MARTNRKGKSGNTFKDKDRRNMKPSRQCLNHGGCPYCENGRKHSTEKRKPIEEKEDGDDKITVATD